MVPFGAMAADLKVDPWRLSSAQRSDVLCRCIVAAVLVSRRVRRDTSFVGAFAKPSWTTRVGQALLRSLDGELPEDAGPTGVLQVAGARLQMLAEDEHWVGTTLAQALAEEQLIGQETLGIGDRTSEEGACSATAADSGGGGEPAAGSGSSRLAGWSRSSVASLKELLEGLLPSSEPGAGPGASPAGGGETRLLVMREDAPRTARQELEAAHAEGVGRLVFVVGDHKGLKPAALGRIVTDYGGRAVTLGPTPLLTSQCITALHYEMDRLWPASLSAEASWQGRFADAAPAPAPA